MSDVNKQLLYVAEMLKKAGATVPAPQAGGTIESAMLHGLSIALVIVEEAIAAAEQAQQADIGKAISQQSEPVAWCWQFPDGYFYETPHQTKEDCERDCCGYDGVAIPLYDTRGEKTLSTDVVAMLEEAEYVLKQVGCYSTSHSIRTMLAAAQKP